MSSSPFRFRWHRRSVQGLERLWRPTAETRVQHPLKRRRRTLLAITICLHVLLWSSVIPLVTMLALFATHSIDRTFLPSTVLTIVSAVASFSYIILHSIVARRHSRLQHGVTSRKFDNACYFAIRLSVMLCIMWLLTSGWNFIVAARQPVCLPQSFSNDLNDRWRVGSSCAAERFSAAISFVALAASCALFGILAVARRPFEASLLGFSLSALTTNNDINHQSRKLPHPEDGVYSPALRRAADMSTSTLTSLTASSFFRPDTAMTEKTTATSILNGGFAGSTPGPSFPPSPSTGDAVFGARQNPHHFSWVHSPSPSPPPLPLRFATNIPPPLPPPPLLLPAGPIVSASTTAARRVSSAESRYTPRLSLASPYQQRSKSYGQSMPSLLSPTAGSPSSSPPRLLPARPARSPPPLDSAWRAVHPNPPGVTVVVGGGAAGYGNGESDSSPPASAAGAAPSGLNVCKGRVKAKTRLPSMPHSPPRMSSWLSSTTSPTATSSGGWTTMAAVNEERTSSESVGSLALTTAALARLTAEQQAYYRQSQQQQQNEQADLHHNDNVGGANGITRRGHGGRGHVFGHRRILAPSGPPPSMPISVRPVVDHGPIATATRPTTAPSSNNNNNTTTTNIDPVSPSSGRPTTPVHQMLPSAHPQHPSHHPYHPHASNSALLSLLQHRAARQRPLRWSSRRSLSNDNVVVNNNNAGSNSNHSLSSSSHRRSSSCGTSSPLSTTMVRACEVDAEVLREEIAGAERMRREAFGGGDAEEEEEDEDDGKGLEIVRQVRGVERSGRWCRVRRGFGVGGGGAGKKKSVFPVVDGEGGDLGIEGRNWVRNASGEQSVAGKSEGEDGVEREREREREDSGVQWEMTVTTASSERGSSSSCGPPEPERSESSAASEPEQLQLPKRRLLPSWGDGVVAGKSPEQSFLEAVLAAGKVSPLLLQQQQLQQLGGEARLKPASASSDDDVDGNQLSRSVTVIRRRARSVEGTRQGNTKGSAGGGTRITEQAMDVGLGLSCVIGVGSGAEPHGFHGQQDKEAGAFGVKRAPRTRRKTVVLG